MFTVDSISIRYEQKNIINNFSFSVKKGEIVSIIGPNGSGKSTLLKAVSRLIPYHTGAVTLEGTDLKSMTAKQVARKMCMLSQKNQAPNDMTVIDLVSYGRYPHKKWFEKLNHEDMDIVDWALEKTHLKDYKDRAVSSLSGGESQRAWIAMALAQRPLVMLLDEPTTYLDISHQHEVLELVRELNQDMGMTVVMVLHDLNQASTYSDSIVVVQAGEKAMYGTPNEVMTTDMIRDIYRMDAEVQYVPTETKPRIHLLSTVR
ncbi:MULTISPECIES: ABC transporter ATP-binding protein [Paenibacillus]|jgi:iron complex transport system ATP-binding protein|uniref:Iron ABC transporter ATP-binding protein n=1 Tax=Paenibacillus odorifer TaxID=189426 RepID=A0ABX3GK74_9BACL|nr:ABC transporter ATP-binding protein [Paenibacillus odorifer]OMC78095.1 iron ABC transporter ATP-binding protein [Paenibacillus odorifer]OMD29025.1 iron ABC transporter ATP-binding protein [Paenibacillus odorifer]OMD72199.1 iron ABC transporter ATP-binding protein [Paenibacillus odorifer]OMD75608.1 iron ABC transporter ATP-binding protein [Paenibacillus odorifer]OMD84321.1 iron ABC transporter ATP-binding protein [Paenibacillus odorifer]